MLFGYLGVFLVGGVLGLLGGGGSILSVPILTYLFGFPASTATVYSLFLVGVSSLIGTASYLQRNLVAPKVGTFFLVPSIAGVTFARRIILPALPAEIIHVENFVLTKDRLILLVFALVMVIASYSMLRARGETSPLPAGSEGSPVRIGTFGFAAGLLMGFVGAGGGFLVIPVLVEWGKLPMKLAIGTSLLIITVSSLMGFAGDIAAGTPVDWRFLTVLCVLSILGVLAGARVSTHISGARLKRAFGILVLAIALIIVVSELVGGARL